MAVNPYGVIKGFDIFPDKRFCGVIVGNGKAVQPFSFNHCVEGFDAGVVVRIAFMTVASLQAFCGFPVALADILAATI